MSSPGRQLEEETQSQGTRLAGDTDLKAISTQMAMKLQARVRSVERNVQTLEKPCAFLGTEPCRNAIFTKYRGW